jgi:hypothetical protein
MRPRPRRCSRRKSALNHDDDDDDDDDDDAGRKGGQALRTRRGQRTTSKGDGYV